MKINYAVGNEKDSDYIDDRLGSYNKKKKSVTQEEDYKKFVVTAMFNGEIIGGGVAYSSLYHIGYLDTLWVDESFRHQYIGSNLLDNLEDQLRDYGCELCHLDTFDFQAPEFYKSKGYEVFGELHHKRNNITEFFLKKDL